MPTITLYAGKANQVPGLMGNARRSVREYRADLEALRTRVLSIDSSTCDVEEVIRSIRASSQTQEAKEEALGRLEAEVEGFLAAVVRMDGEVADVIFCQ